MITPEKIDEWIREVEERPASAPLIIRMVANRLSALSKRYEEVLAENTVLLTGKKIEDYEARIASLEYQLDLLKRQLAGEPAGTASAGETPAGDGQPHRLYPPGIGAACRARSRRAGLRQGARAVRKAAGRTGRRGGHPLFASAAGGPVARGAALPVRFGRTVAMPVAAIPAADGELDWGQASIEEPRGGEELAAIVPIGRMPLSDCCVQASRQGAVKKMVRSAFESYVAKNYVGTGVKQTTDRTGGLALCDKDDRVVLASQEGWLLTVETARLSYAIEETLRLSATDHIVTVFAVGQKKQVVFLTDGGKCIAREAGLARAGRDLAADARAARILRRAAQGRRPAGGSGGGRGAGLGRGPRQRRQPGDLPDERAARRRDGLREPPGGSRAGSFRGVLDPGRLSVGIHVGIDFGTSNSGVAISDGRDVKVLPIDPKNLTPEVVKTILYITRDYKISIGQEAVDLYYRHNINRLRRFVKKRAGELEYRGADLFYVTDVYVYVDELQPGRLLQFIKTALRSEAYQGTQIFDRYYTIVDIIALYLQGLKARAEKLLGEPVDGVTLGRPVKLSPNPDRDREAEQMLRQAAYEAGFKQVDLELEPVAAARYYELSMDRPQTALVFDFGGGTLDITILRLGDPHNRQVYANGGIDIAGSDFDRAIIQKRMLPHFGQGQVESDPHIRELVEAVSDWMALPELSVPGARVRLERAILGGMAPARLKALEALIFNDLAFSFYNAVEGAKIALSSQGAALIALEAKDLDLWELYTRTQFERDIGDHQERIEQVVLGTLAASGFEPGQIDVVVKTGGSSSIPIFSEMLETIFGKERVKSSDAFSSVTAGLGICAARGKS